MFNQYVIVDGSLRKTGDGFAVDLRIPYYRGLGLSMVDVALSIDGTPVPKDAMRFTVHGREYAMTELEDQVDDRWGFREAATVTVKDFPLADGSHDVAVTVTLRVSYMPVPSVTSVTKTLQVA